MCLILDANKYGDFLNKDNKDMQPVKKWLEKNGKLVYAPTEKFGHEWQAVDPLERQLTEWRRAGKMKMADTNKVNEEEQRLQGRLSSNDGHIIALARVANVKLLVSNDQDLHQDFTNCKLVKGGKVYQDRRHKHLLRPDTCP